MPRQVKTYAERIVRTVETCPTCHRPGMEVVRKPLVLTGADQEVIFGCVKVSNIAFAPINAEACYVLAGSHIVTCAQEGIELAKMLGRPVAFEFNERIVVCREDDDVDDVVATFRAH